MCVFAEKHRSLDARWVLGCEEGKNTLCTGMISVVEVPVSPYEDKGRKIAAVFH